MKISIIGAAGTLGSCATFNIITHNLADEIDIQKLSMYPAGMLVEPFVDELAEKLKICLAKAQTAKPSN